MRKTKKTELTNEVRIALLDLKEVAWRDLPLVEAGYSEKNYAGVRRVLMNSMLNIEFIANLMLMCGKDRIETEHIALQVDGKNYAAVEDATFALKTNLAETKPVDMAWRELALEYGYVASSGSFSRAIKGRKWAPVEMIYMMCKRFNQKQVSGEHDGVKITFTVKK